MGGHRFGAEQPSGETADCPRQWRGGRGPAENKKCLPNTPTGGPISPDSVLHTLHRVLERAGLAKFRFHDLRHAFATQVLQNGGDIKAVSGMLGPFSAGFTLDTYAHIMTAAPKEAARTIEKVLTAAI